MNNTSELYFLLNSICFYNMSTFSVHNNIGNGIPYAQTLREIPRKGLLSPAVRHGEKTVETMVQ